MIIEIIFTIYNITLLFLKINREIVSLIILIEILLMVFIEILSYVILTIHLIIKK